MLYGATGVTPADRFRRHALDLEICAMSDYLGTQLRILLASDLTDRAVLAFDRAVQLAISQQAHLTILHAIRDDLIKDVGEIVYGAAHEALQNQVADARARGATDADMKVVLAAHYDAAIIAESRQDRAHLIVLGSHRERPLRDAVLGATMERVLRFGDRSILVVKTSPTGSYSDILVAVDFSVPARDALEFAIRLFPRGRFHVLNACPNVLGDTASEWFVSPETVARKHEAQLEVIVQAVAHHMRQELSGADFMLTPVVDHGHPAEAAKRQIARIRPDLVVVGTHGHTGWRHATVGSVAESFLAWMPCDVLAVRQMHAEGGGRLSTLT
ncbi:MAG: universal stress protein [Hyphomicrobium sp.]|nr:universal stress protein [Hyphomicrobium sp.]